MNVVLRAASLFLGRDTAVENTVKALESVQVPISLESCRSCPDPCNDQHDDYPRRLFTVDTLSDMRGSVKPYYRQVVISTSQTDWSHDITDDKTSLAAYLTDVHSHFGSARSADPKHDKLPTGVISSQQSTRLSILNGSHRGEDTSMVVLVFPDYKVVYGVEPTERGAEALWRGALDPALGQASDSQTPEATIKSHPLTYNCVILLCSHKKRDNRCAIAAPILESAFTHALTILGWSVDTDVDLHSITSTQPNIELRSTEGKSIPSLEQTIVSQEPKRALILKNSHVGGHKFAGNVIIYNPQGAGVWYGRVSPHEVDSIVKNTILDGKILPTLFRGGINISRPNCSSLNDW